MILHVLLLGVLVSRGGAARLPRTSDNVAAALEVVSHVGAAREELEAAVRSVLPHYRAPAPHAPVLCDGCMSIIAGLQGFIYAGMNYTDARPIIVESCTTFLNNMSARGDIICPGFMDNYFSHFFYILAYKDWDTFDVCKKYLFCDDDDNIGNFTADEYAKHDWTEVAKQTRDVPEKKHEQNTFTIAQITDFHVDPDYQEGAPATRCGTLLCCRQRYPGEGLARRWGEYECNLPHRTAELILRQVSELNPQPDFIIYSGDNPPHALWEETYETQAKETRWLVDAMTRQFPAGTKVYPAIGNHEVYPSNMYYIPRPEVRRFQTEFHQLWMNLTNFDQNSIDTIETAGYYTLLFKPGLRIVNYNTNYGYIFNFYNIINEERTEFSTMVRWLNTTLRNARQNNEKVIMIGHHPSGGDMTYYSGPMTRLFNAYSDVIVLMVHGHTHRNEFRVAVREGRARTVGLVSGTAGTLPYMNPAVRLFQLDPGTFQLQNYQQYHLPINNLTGTEEPRLQLQYSCREEYGMFDLSPSSFLDLINRMNTDEALFEKFRRNKNARSVDPSPCDAECKRDELCNLRSVTIGEYRACVKDGTKTKTK